MNLKQILGGLVVVLGALMVSTAQLQDIFGPAVAKSIVSLASILNMICGGWLTILTNQANTVASASDVKGVEVTVSKDAPQAVAALAMSETQQSISPVPGQEQAVADVAKGV